MVMAIVRRLFHWGPVLAMLIIKCVTLTTLHVTSMWLPSFQCVLGTLNHILYLILVGLTMYNFFCSAIIGPGFVPTEWKPDNLEDTRYLQYCVNCKGYKAPRAHHCSRCNRCVKKMDHHCPWINNCCGFMNHANFTLFLLFAVLGAIHSSFLLGIALYRAFYWQWYFYQSSGDGIVYLEFMTFILTVFSLGLSLGVIIAVGGLFYVQIKSIIKNETSIESWIITKANSRKRPSGKPFIYPYNVGWKENLKQVFSSRENDGMMWPVAEGCTQFTLSIEQLEQKQDKRFRTRQYAIIEAFSGAWFPVTKGFKVWCCPPCTDEPRIPLKIGDQVLVTRWRRHWLYGELCSKTLPQSEDGKRPKGWFPRRCAVEFASADSELANNLKKRQ